MQAAHIRYFYTILYDILFLNSTILSLLATYPISSTYILPVERNSIFTFSKELSISKQEAVDHFHAMTSKNKTAPYELLFKKTTRYPLPIKDGLMIADDLAETKKNTSTFDKCKVFFKRVNWCCS